MLQENRSLKRNFVWIASGRFVYAASQWLLLAVIARLATVEDLGVFTYALAVTSPVIVLAQLNMRAFMITDARDEFELREYLYTQLVTLSIALVIIVAIAFYSDATESARLIILAVGLYKATEAISGIFYGASQKQELMAPVGISMAAHGLSAALIMSVMMLTSGSVSHGVLGILLAWLIILLSLDVRMGAGWLAGSGRTQSLSIWRIVNSCFPLGVTAALLTLRINLPVYFIKAELGVEQVGYYSAVAYFLVVGNLLSGSLTQVSSPRLARYYFHEETKKFLFLFRKHLGILSFGGMVGVVFIAFFAADVLWLIYGSEYAKHSGLLVWISLAVATGFISQFFGVILTVARLFRYQVISNISGIAVIVVLSIYCIPVYGIDGGAIALLGGAFVSLLINAFVSWRYVLSKMAV